MNRHPAVPYVLPFAVFILLLAVHAYLPLPENWEFPARVVILAAVLWTFSRRVIDLRVTNLPGSLLVGVAVFVIWIGPDALWPAYRQHWLFQNSITGKTTSSIPQHLQISTMVLIFRAIRAVVIVPIVEELFWRGWLMRWLVSSNFEQVPLGAYTAQAFWITAALFASEHGPYWDVGLVAGVVYNWWMIRTKHLGDCILAHAVTNACLSAYVLLAGKWEYWL